MHLLYYTFLILFYFYFLQKIKLFNKAFIIFFSNYLLVIVIYLLKTCITVIAVSFVSDCVAPMISITEAGRESTENGREPHLELHSDSKVCMFINQM